MSIEIRSIPGEIPDGFSGIPVNPNSDTNPRCEVSVGNIRIDVRRADARRVAEVLGPGRANGFQKSKVKMQIIGR